METRNIALTLEKAKEWYNSGNETLKEAALQAFTEEELKEFDFRSIKTFEDAILVVCPNDYANVHINLKEISRISKASAASFKLNIIRKALNKGYEMKFDEGEIWYPYNLILAKNSEHCRGNNAIEITKVKVNGRLYTLLGGNTDRDNTVGIGCFSSYIGTGFTNAYAGFLGCATEEIAEHFGRYFAKEIFEAKYGDFVNFEWV